MLVLEIPTIELYDESREEFIVIPEEVLTFEHSLLSLSKWESKWHKPFLSKESKTHEELLDYLRCMCITKPRSPLRFLHLPASCVDQLREYIYTDATATTVKEVESKSGTQMVTSELIYSWMVNLSIPFEVEKWHLSRLLILCRVLTAQNSEGKRLSPEEAAQRHRDINARNRALLNSKG